MISNKDAEEFTQSLGQIVGASYRQILLAKRLGVPKALGLKIDEWVNQRLNGYIKMNAVDRRKVVAELTAEGESSRAIGEVLGVSHTTIGNDLKDGKNLPEKPADNGISGKNLPDPQPNPRAVREAANKAKLQAPAVIPVDGLHFGDFRELSAAIPDESVELVFTDPPYDRESAPLYADAAKVAARILKPGGSMICYTGQVLLPIVVPQMNAYLRYWWTAACIHEDGNQMLQKLGIRCGWKPKL